MIVVAMILRPSVAKEMRSLLTHPDVLRSLQANLVDSVKAIASPELFAPIKQPSFTCTVSLQNPPVPVDSTPGQHIFVPVTSDLRRRFAALNCRSKRGSATAPPG